LDYRKFDPSITIQKQVVLLSSAVTVLKATMSIIAHIHNNATLKPRAAILSIRRGIAAVPLPAPRSGLMGPGGVGVRPTGSLAPDRIRGQAGGLAPERGRRPVAVELAIGARGRAGGRTRGRKPRGWSEARLEAAGRRASGRPDQAGGNTQARPKGGHPAIGTAWGSRRRPKAVSEAVRAVVRGTRSSDKAEPEDDRGRAGSAPPRGLGKPVQAESRRRGLMGGRWIGLGGLSREPAAGERRSPPRPKGRALRAFGDGQGVGLKPASQTRV
jgi:hypothetical protein